MLARGERIFPAWQNKSELALELRSIQRTIRGASRSGRIVNCRNGIDRHRVRQAHGRYDGFGKPVPGRHASPREMIDPGSLRKLVAPRFSNFNCSARNFSRPVWRAPLIRDYRQSRSFARQTLDGEQKIIRMTRIHPACPKDQVDAAGCLYGLLAFKLCVSVHIDRCLRVFFFIRNRRFTAEYIVGGKVDQRDSQAVGLFGQHGWSYRIDCTSEHLFLLRAIDRGIRRRINDYIGPRFPHRVADAARRTKITARA